MPTLLQAADREPLIPSWHPGPICSRFEFGAVPDNITVPTHHPLPVTGMSPICSSQCTGVPRPVAGLLGGAVMSLLNHVRTVEHTPNSQKPYTHPAQSRPHPRWHAYKSVTCGELLRRSNDADRCAGIHILPLGLLPVRTNSLKQATPHGGKFMAGGPKPLAAGACPLRGRGEGGGGGGRGPGRHPHGFFRRAREYFRRGA